MEEKDAQATPDWRPVSSLSSLGLPSTATSRYAISQLCFLKLSLIVRRLAIGFRRVTKLCLAIFAIAERMPILEYSIFECCLSLYIGISDADVQC